MRLRINKVFAADRNAYDYVVEQEEDRGHWREEELKYEVEVEEEFKRYVSGFLWWSKYETVILPKTETRTKVEQVWIENKKWEPISTGYWSDSGMYVRPAYGYYESEEEAKFFIENYNKESITHIYDTDECEYLEFEKTGGIIQIGPPGSIVDINNASN